MKNTLYTPFAIAIVALTSLFMMSCDKKAAVMPDHDVMVTMTYAPNPATVDTAIQFSFSVMDMGAATDVSEINCAMMQGATALNAMSITRSDMGMYMGAYTFTKRDTCKITFNYNHGGEMMMQEFMISVK